jgi:hydroxyacyl-ACP dehydratase HTD2-like protein with hotdog domain
LRTTLRIYAPDAQPGTFARVELRDWEALQGTPKFSATVALNAPQQPTTLPIYPGFAQLTLQDAFPAAALSAYSYNVSVVPLPFDSTSTPRIWAFISIINNVTQEVTIQRPQ